MIIRRDENELLFITQPDHARLAEAVLARWQADRMPDHPRRASLLIAAREHDNGWREPDDALVFDRHTGRPLDFASAPDDVKQAVWPRGVDRVRDPYVAALIARHAACVYDAHRQKPTWSTFFAAMEDRRRALLDRSGISDADLEADYRFLSVADLLSLAFCNGWTDEHERFGCRVRCDRGTVRVAPAVLGSAPVMLRVRARRLIDRAYGSAADARAAVEAAPVELLEGVAIGDDRRS